MNGRTLGAIIGASVGAWVGMEVTNKQVLPTVLFTGTFALLGASAKEIVGAGGTRKNPMLLPGSPFGDLSRG